MSLMLESNVDIKTVQEHARHKKTTVTLELYVQTNRTHYKESIQKFESYPLNK